MHYKPLPDCVTIRVSDIDGLGLFCVTYINKGYSLGISHVEDSRFPNRYIRTPLGGFINHDETPNCKTVDMDGYKYLTAAKDIEPGEELTLRYTMYNLDLTN